MRHVPVLILAAAVVLSSSSAFGQSRQPDWRDRQEVARAQGVPPGQLPPPSQCRVWYDDRPNGRQPAPTSCERAETIAEQDRDARVIYGEDAYFDARRRGRLDDSSRYPDDDRAVRRGSVRDPRSSGNVIDRDDRDDRSPAFRNGYRDGLTKGREDFEDGKRYDVSRHSWYRSATRGYENRHGTRYKYIDGYRRGFETGYAQGYRLYQRR